MSDLFEFPSQPHVGPHKFEPLRRFFNRGRCRACYIHEHAHPIGGWTLARPLGDRQRKPYR